MNGSARWRRWPIAVLVRRPWRALLILLGCFGLLFVSLVLLLDWDRLHIEASGACVKDMEAAAVADVARLLGVPMLAVKAITDLVDAHAPTPDQFLANLGVATAQLREALLDMIDWCADRTVAELGGDA